AANAETPTLAHGDELDGVDAADVGTGVVDHSTGMQGEPVTEELAASAGRGDEAHVLAVRLVRRAQAQARGVGAYLGLRELTNREEDARELGLPEHVQHVGLVLGLVGATAQVPPAGVITVDARVVSGGDSVEAELAGPVQEPVELEVPVALDARVGGASFRVGGHVRIDNMTVEVVGEVEHVVGHTELLSDTPSVLDVGDRAAARVAGAAPELHRGPDDVVALLQQQGGGHRRVDAARHGGEHAHQRPRRRATASGTTLRARSTSSSVVVGPSDSRTLLSASAASMPMAVSTCDGSMAPLVQAEPAEAQTPASSSRISRASLSIPSNRR